jgi:hypothetical protein
MVVPGARFLNILYAVNKSTLACADTPSLMCIAPFTTPGRNPVIEVPGFNETSPLITELPVLVIAEVAMIPKVLAEPSNEGGNGATIKRHIVE